MTGEPPAVQIQFTIDDHAAGVAIAEALLAERLAACVQEVDQVTSRYRWQGQVTVAQEWLFLVKTTAARTEACTAAIVERHPYDIPEVIVTEVVAGHPPYLAWVEAEASPATGA